METNWFQFGATLVGGGLAGAFVKQLFDNRRNRLQPIEYSYELKPFYDITAHSIIPSKIILKEDGKEYPFTNLVIGSLTIKNTGILDFPKFTFGMTLDEDASFINIKQDDEHRHSLATYDSIPSIQSPLNKIDLELTPFNRKNIYTFNFLISSKYGTETEDIDFSVSSSQAVKLNNVKNDRMLRVSFEVIKPVLKIGPLSVGFDR